LKRDLFPKLVLAGVLCLQFLPAQAPPTFQTGANEILVDVVVRDKRGKLMRGLKQSDIKILEDGVEQPITLFREVQAAAPRPDSTPAAAAPAAASSAAPEPTRVAQQVRLISLVYDRLGPDGRRLSRQASLDFIAKDLGPGVYYGVYSIDRNFRVIQPYTNDMTRLRAAIDKATSGERSDFDNNPLMNVVNATQGSEGAAAAASAAGGSNGAPQIDGAAMSNEAAGAMAQQAAEFAELLDREDLGRVSVFSMWAIVKQLKTLPGRKSILYFAEALQMPNGLVQQFESMISEANRANVSFYVVDARGLLSTSDQQYANQKLAAAAQWSRYARTTETESAEGNKEEFRTFDRAMDSLKGNGQMVMAALAETTGGALMANTNDFRPYLQKLSEDLNTYYEVAYRPATTNYDGRFRAITVKVNRSDAAIQARSGYFSLPPMSGQTVFPYEVPLLNALAKNPLPKDLEYRARVLQFRDRGGSRQASLVFDLPLKNITFAKDEKAKAYRTHVSLLALVKDSQGQVVGKLSRDLALNEPPDKLDAYKQGRLILTRPLTLAPGRYTVESVAADYEANKMAAKKSVLVVQQQAAGPALSDLSLVRRIDKPAESPDLADPLQLAVGRVIPTLIDGVPGGKSAALSVFFMVYGEDGSAEKPQLVLDLLQDGKVVSRSKAELPAADASGAMPYLANIPLESVPAGQYEFRATAIQAGKGAQRSLFVTIE
jgi:VWFA-related protein